MKRTSDLLIHPGEHLNLSDFDPENTFGKSQGEIKYQHYHYHDTTIH
ncbi:MAG TPA: hypothetical protein VK566_03485 [Nitrososphaeraceae archaeon]|nr:hypothetical protein [Nitrososphaeraceae archaeon]